MANAHIVLSVAYIDEKGAPASTPFYGVLPDTTTLATMLTNVATFVALIGGVTLDAVTGVSIGVEGPGVGTADTGSISQRGVNIAMEVVGTRDWSFWIPALDPTLIVGGRVNITTGAIADLSAALVAGTGAIQWESAYRNGFVDIESAAETFRKLRGAPTTKSVNPAV